jgi:hypothetical protein
VFGGTLRARGSIRGSLGGHRSAQCRYPPGMSGTNRCNDRITTDLLTEWTDPDTTMEAIGTTLGVFDEQVVAPHQILATDPHLRDSLQGVLACLVRAGVLGTRPCSDGRYAYRWQDGPVSPGVLASKAEFATGIEHDPGTDTAADTATVTPAVTAPRSPTARRDQPVSRIEQAGLLVIPMMSCALVVLAFVTLNHAIALAITTVLVLVGVIGLMRRAPLAGSWIIGLTVAGLLIHFS